MTRSRYRLTPALQRRICSFIVSGSYPHVAAEAEGIPRAIFDDWLDRGRVRRAPKKYREFYDAVIIARAQVRLSAEAKTLSKDPLAWLKCGPGKEGADGPGWSNPVKGAVPSSDEAAKLLLNREVQELFKTLLTLLEPHPEVRASLAAALMELDKKKQSK